jgi:hypothetical protein
MSRVLKETRVNGTHLISTIQTCAGGGAPSAVLGSPFTSADFASETPWPYETAVFLQDGSSRGLYHEAHGTETSALSRHEEIASAVCHRQIDLEDHPSVCGSFGVPSLTPEQWIAQKEQLRGDVSARYQRAGHRTPVFTGLARPHAAARGVE